jgi:hypothetical protein
MTQTSEHQKLAEALKHAVLEAPALTKPEVRQAVSARAMGGPAIDRPYDDLAKQMGVAAYKVTDEQLRNVLTTAGSQKGAFEIVAASAVGAGLLRWNIGNKVLQEAINAAT